MQRNFQSFLIHFFILFSIVFLSSCKSEKPVFLAQEDYSYLDRENRLLLVLLVKLEGFSYIETDLERQIVELNESFDFQQSYRKQLAKELLKWQSHPTIQMDLFQEEKSLSFIPYIGKSYPKEELKDYDLILELNVYALLSFESNGLDLFQRENLRLIDVQSSKTYLASHSNKVYRNISRKIFLDKDPMNFRRYLVHFLNRSSAYIVEYILNEQSVPIEKDLTPKVPELDT